MSSLSSLKPSEHELPGIVKAVHQEGGLLLIGVSSRTNLELTLVDSTTLQSSRGEIAADRIGLWVDEPREVATKLRDHASTERV